MIVDYKSTRIPHWVFPMSFLVFGRKFQLKHSEIMAVIERVERKRNVPAT